MSYTLFLSLAALAFIGYVGWIALMVMGAYIPEDEDIYDRMAAADEEIVQRHRVGQPNQDSI